MKTFKTVLSFLPIIVGLWFWCETASADDKGKIDFGGSHINLYDWSMDKHEVAWHTLNAVDMLQTINFAKEYPCYHEANPLTRRIIGKSPSTGEVIAVSLFYSGAIHYMNQWINNHPKMPKWTKNTVFTIQFVTKFDTVVINNHIDGGVRPWGDNRYSYDGNGGCVRNF